MYRPSFLKILKSSAALGLLFTLTVLPKIGNAANALVIQSVTHPGPIIVACVGDSITAGVGSTATDYDYPSLLQELLGPGYKVINFGESGATLLKNGDSPYWQRGSFPASKSAAPDVVIIMLGTNDSKPWNWKFKDQFTSDYAALANYYAGMVSHPQIYAVLPPPVPGTGNYGINEANVDQEIPMIEKVARDDHLSIIDVQTGMPMDSKYFADNVHPDDQGYVLLASTIYFGLTHAPAILPIANRTFSGTETVTILAPDARETIHYTVDGTNPTRRSPIYSTPIILGAANGQTLAAVTTIKAQAFKGKRAAGDVSSADFTPATPAPAAAPPIAQ
jgi:acyl-CoA thioesterase-1